MSRERGQALVETVAAVPVFLAASLLVVASGVVVRDRLVLAQATGQAGTAIVRGLDPRTAARDVLPARLRPTMQFTHREERVTISVRSSLPLVPDAIVQRSSVEVPA